MAWKLRRSKSCFACRLLTPQQGKAHMWGGLKLPSVWVCHHIVLRHCVQFCCCQRRGNVSQEMSLGKTNLRKKIFSLICEEKHTESPSQSSCGLWVKSILFGYRLVFSYGVCHLYLGTGWGESKKSPYSCSWLCLDDTGAWAWPKEFSPRLRASSQE